MTMAEWRARNRERIRASHNAWNRANRDRVAANNRRYAERHSQEVAAYKRSWFAANRAKKALYRARRAARLAGAAGSHTLIEWQEKCFLLGNVCLYCGETRPLTRDHKTPLIRGGSDSIENIAPACARCNRRKGTRTAAEFLAAAA